MSPQPPDLPEDKVRSSREETNVLIEEAPWSAADGPGWPPSPVGWFRMLAKELHWSFVFGVVATYGVSQGLGGGITRVVADYYSKDVQRVQPSAAQMYQGVTSIPWMVKPLCGMLTDVLPVAGYRRRPYFVLAGICRHHGSERNAYNLSSQQASCIVRVVGIDGQKCKCSNS